LSVKVDIYNVNHHTVGLHLIPSSMATPLLQVYPNSPSVLQHPGGSSTAPRAGASNAVNSGNTRRSARNASGPQKASATAGITKAARKQCGGKGA